jgi:hypothetical protein
MVRKTILERTLWLPVLVTDFPFLTGMKLHQTKDVVDNAKAAVAAAQSKVTRYGVYEYSLAKAAVEIAQTEYDEMDYIGAERFAKKAMKLAEKATTKQAF